MEDDSYFEDEEFSPVRSLLGLLTFSTILPIKVYTSIEYMTKLTWCWPFLHLFIGILAAICGYVSLEYFLGEDYKNYQHVPGIYDYMIPNLKREKIVPDALYHWICSEYPLQKEGGNLLDNMIHYGKMLYTIESILPNIDKKLLIGYNQEQWDWCEENEKGMCSNRY